MDYVTILFLGCIASYGIGLASREIAEFWERHDTRKDN